MILKCGIRIKRAGYKIRHGVTKGWSTLTKNICKTQIMQKEKKS